MDPGCLDPLRERDQQHSSLSGVPESCEASYGHLWCQPHCAESPDVSGLPRILRGFEGICSFRVVAGRCKAGPELKSRLLFAVFDQSC